VSVCAEAVVSDDSSETDSAEESSDVVKPSVRRVVKKRKRKLSTAEVTLQNKVLLANVNSPICYRPSVCDLSVVCNVCAPYSGGSNFWQYFYGIRYLGHPLTSTEYFTEIVPGEPLCRGSNTTGVAKYSDFGPIDGYISETVQDRR